MDGIDEETAHLGNPISSSSYAHDQQVIDALAWLRLNYPTAYCKVVNEYPGCDKPIMESASSGRVDIDRMGVEPEFMSWVCDAIEDTGLVAWWEGEPWATK